MKKIVISLKSHDGFGNRMIQYMAALRLQAELPGSSITGLDLPEWGLFSDDNPDPDGFDQLYTVPLFEPGRFDIRQIVRTAREDRSTNIIIDDYCQRMDLLLPRHQYDTVFPAGNALIEIGSNELLINIRAGDILRGVSHYPLLPVSYYKWLIDRTRLEPVFCGQLESSRYSDLIRAEFPEARFIESQGTLADFQMIRTARHIAPSASTFSWLAAWLSSAETIFLPLYGFLNPAHERGIDLVPIEDARYRYVLFPLCFGLPEEQMLQQHRRMNGRWREISAAQVAFLKSSSPFLPARTSMTPFDATWYAHAYIDAAQEISDGWFSDPMHHYLEVGRLRGYSPTAAAAATAAAGQPARLIGRNVAMEGIADQSSVSRWSTFATTRQEASIALSGRIWEEKFFHTDLEDAPWWRVDLGRSYDISAIRIFNRRGADFLRARAAPLLVEGSCDGLAWFELFQTPADQYLDGRDGSAFTWLAPKIIAARHVRITLLKHEFLHLAEVEVYESV